MILRFLGAGNVTAETDAESEKRLQAQIDYCEEEVLSAIRPRAVHRIFKLTDGHIPDLELPGRDIARLLEGCHEAVIMALTLGAALEKRLMREEVTDMANAVIMDACASCAVELAADQYEENLRSEIMKSGRFLTNRFSPGYGDLPLSVQRPILEAVNAGRAIGLTLTPTNLMVPRKSITAILGISRRPHDRVMGGCSHCPVYSKCAWRAQGTRCYE